MCHELELLKRRRLKVYSSGFPERIKGNITSSKPATLHEAINMARELVEQAVQGRAARIGESNKRKWEDNQRNNNNNNHNYNNNHNSNNNHNNNNNRNRNNNHHQATKQETKENVQGILLAAPLDGKDLCKEILPKCRNLGQIVIVFIDRHLNLLKVKRITMKSPEDDYFRLTQKYKVSETVKNWKTPDRQLKFVQFLDLGGLLPKLIEIFSKIAKPPHTLVDSKDKTTPSKGPDDFVVLLRCIKTRFWRCVLISGQDALDQKERLTVERASAMSITIHSGLKTKNFRSAKRKLPKISKAPTDC
ncbi:hypothetical protein Tco_0605661 [Tanacetum coccineum]